MKFIKLVVPVAALCFLATHMAKSQDVAVQNAAPTVESSLLTLQQIMSDKPAEATVEVVTLVDQIAATKRVDAAILLIRAMSFNLDTNTSLESYSQEEMIPAIRALKRYYGSQVLPFLFVEGITTDKEWMRERCALAVRYTGTVAEIQSMKVVFALAANTQAGAKKFNTLLNSKDLRVTLFRPGSWNPTGKLHPKKSAPKSTQR